MNTNTQTDDGDVEQSRAKARKPRFNLRGFTSLSIAIASLLMVVSGVMLYIAPRGRVANWTDWTVLGLNKDEWADLHMTMAILFLAAIVLHLFFNWRVLVHYVRSRPAKPHLRLRELVAALLLAILIAVGTIRELPPFTVVETANTAIKNYWENQLGSRGNRSPGTRVQEATLPDFAAWAGIPFTEMMHIFEDAGYPVEDPMMSINDFARHYGVSSKTLFELARSQSDRPE